MNETFFKISAVGNSIVNPLLRVRWGASTDGDRNRATTSFVEDHGAGTDGGGNRAATSAIGPGEGGA